MANPPRNLYDEEDFFRITVAGIMYYIDEPVGWDALKIKGERDKDYYGFNYEMFDDEISLLFTDKDGGGDILQDLYNRQGGDAEAIFEFGYAIDGEFTVVFKGNVNFNTYNRGLRGITASIERTRFNSLLRTRADVKINFNETVDLEGGAVNPPTPIYMMLHSRTITKSGKARSPDDLFIPEDMGKADRFTFIIPDTSFSEKEQIGTIFGLNLGITDENPKDSKLFHFEAEEAGKATVKVSADYVISLRRSTFNIGDWNLEPLLELQRGNVTIIKVGNPAYNFKGHTNSRNLDIHHYFDLSFTTDLQVGDRVYFYTYLGLQSRAAQVTFKSFKSSIEVTQETTAPRTVSKGYRIFDVMKHVVRMITGRDNVVKSYFFDVGGPGGMYALFNGFALRGFADKPFLISWDEIIKGNLATWFTGIQFSINVTNDDIIIIEPVTGFFNKEKRILEIKELFNYEEKHLKDVTYNEVEVGFDKYADDADNALDDANTKGIWLSPIRSYKAKYTKLSNYITSGYLIEQVRREQFKKSPSTSLSLDDNIFLIAYLNERYYRDVAFNTSGGFITFGRNVDLIKGDRFRIYTAAGTNNGQIFYTLNKDYSAYNKFRVQPSPATASGTCDIEILSTLPTAERDESFAIVKNIPSPETAYNLRLTVAHILYNHSPILNVGWHKKRDEEVLKNTYYKNNGQLVTQFSISEPNPLLLDNYVVTEAGDIPLKDFNRREALFEPIEDVFQTTISYQDMVQLRKSLRGENAAISNYGTIVYPVLIKKERYEGYIWNFEYEPFRELLTVTVRRLRKII